MTFEKLPPAAVRALPHSIEAEEYLLSCCFLDGATTVAKCIEAKMTPLDFFFHANQIIFDQILEIFTTGKELDLAVIAQELKTAKKLDEIGGYAYLMQISRRIPTTAQASYFIEKVRELYLLRELIKTASQAVANCYAYEGGGVSECVASQISKMMTLANGSTDAGEKDWDGVVDDSTEELKSLIKNKGPDESRIIHFPWPRMDDLFAPMQRGQLVIVAARPSVGKSSLSRPMLASAARSGNHAYFVTLEVNPSRVPLQISASMAGIGLRQVSNAHASDQRDVLQALSSLKGMGVTISKKDRSLTRITSRARALKAKGLIDIMFVDHGGCLEDVFNCSENGKLIAIERVTKTLKALAVELDIVVVLLWQLNRESAKNGNREPTMTDLKACGSLEEDADKILLIHRPDTDPLSGDSKQAESMSIAELPRYYQNIIQAKGRDDGTSLMSFYFQRATATFIPAQIPDS